MIIIIAREVKGDLWYHECVRAVSGSTGQDILISENNNCVADDDDAINRCTNACKKQLYLKNFN